ELELPEEIEDVVVDVGKGDVDIDKILVGDLIIGQKVIGHYFGVELKVIGQFCLVEQGLGDQGEHIVLMDDHDLGKILSQLVDPPQSGLELLEQGIGGGGLREPDFFESEDPVVDGVRHTKRKSIQASLNGQFPLGVVLG